MFDPNSIVIDCGERVIRENDVYVFSKPFGRLYLNTPQAVCVSLFLIGELHSQFTLWPARPHWPKRDLFFRFGGTVEMIYTVPSSPGAILCDPGETELELRFSENWKSEPQEAVRKFKVRHMPT